jgi:hypothetical protein
MPSIEYDLRFLRAGIDELERYLLAGDVYWPSGASAPAGEPAYPMLTLSGLFLARLRLEAAQLSPAQQSELGRLSNQMDATRSHWRSAWGKKATAEYRARLTLWNNFLDEYRKRPPAHHDRYAFEVTRRVQLELLGDEALELPAALPVALHGLDLIVKTLLVGGAFVWEASLAPVFPETRYWFLYGSLPETPDPEAI